MYTFTMKQDGKVVASGTATAVMLYEFQKSFMETVGYGNKETEGSFYSLERILEAKPRTHLGWTTKSVDEKIFSFSFYRPYEGREILSC